MLKKIELPSVLVSTVLFVFLFYKQPVGLNYLLYEFTLIAWLLATRTDCFKSTNGIIASIGLIMSGLATVLVYSSLAFFVNILAIFVFVGVLIYPEVKSLISAFGLGIINFFSSIGQFTNRLIHIKISGKKPGGFVLKYRIYIIPIFIIIAFLMMYSASNPIFNQAISNINEFIYHQIMFLVQYLNFSLILTIILGLAIGSFVFFHKQNKSIVISDQLSKDELQRQHNSTNRHFKILALKNEYKAGIFLFIILNAILMIVNIIDIKWVWFDFEWKGNYLKDFVHSATNILILSILVSIALVLYFFRGNLNFFKGNKLLKWLSYIWILQNVILAISVAIRNIYYIQYFALAYKRIGVILFLILTIYGLYTVWLKVKQQKTSSFLFKQNAYAVYFLLVISAQVNWDIVIAKYNFKHAKESFLHLNYMASLSDKALPYLTIPLTELESIAENQMSKFPDEDVFLTPAEYCDRIKRRNKEFIKKWRQKSILGWNLPEYRAFKQLSSHSNVEE